MESNNQHERNRGTQQDQQLPSDTSRDTSLPGREEEVVNNQEQLRTTKSDRGDSTNKDSEGMRPGSEQDDYRRSDAGFRPAEERNDEQRDRQNTGNQEGENGDEGEQSYRQGLGDNDNRNNNVPDIGREDADKTQRETPRM